MEKLKPNKRNPITGRSMTRRRMFLNRLLTHRLRPSRSPKSLISTSLAISRNSTYSTNRCRFNALLTEFQSRSRDAYSINGYQTRIDFIWDIATNPILLDHVEDLLGPNIVLWGSHYFCKMPSDQREVPFHQDATYWPFRPFKTVTAWLAVDDVNLETGPLCFLPRSHRYGKLAWRQRTENVVLGLEVEDYANFGEPHPLLLKSGEFSLHTDLLIHGSVPNLSNVRRCGLTLRYVPPDVRLIDQRYANWIRNAILCRGEDTSGYWPKQTRPISSTIH